MVQSYISRDDRDGLREYIEIYKTELPPDITEVYCRNQVINALVCYYAALARKDRIQFDAQVSYPDNCPVSDTEATVILGNMLENAVDACQRESGTRKIIRLRIRQRKESSLLFITDNTCTVPVRFTEDMKVPLSSKRKGAGIGIMSIREIADRYDGDVRFEQKEGMFYASVSLQFPYEDSSISGCHSWE
ncbi:ATP-binding protein [Enterocloster citroniae]|uniref:ATP-binding protein n=1 Tax=Enterocloster citroniae TaxID=358743 RepID=UPI00349EC032